MKTIVKLSDVYNRYADILQMRANMGRPFSVLICDADKQGLPESFNSRDEADDLVTQLNDRGITASLAETLPFSTNPAYAYRLYIRPVTGFSSWPYTYECC